MTTSINLSFGAIAIAIGASLLTGCEAGKKPEKKASPPPVLTDYTAKKDGDWMNVASIYLFKENPSVTLKRYKNWIGRSFFDLTSQTQRGDFSIAPTKVLNAYEQVPGENPSISYSCSKKKFRLRNGKKMSSITGSENNSSYNIFRTDGKTQWASKTWQIEPFKNEGINALEARINGEPPKEIPKSFRLKEWEFIEDAPKGSSWPKILEAKTFEWSAIPKKDDGTNGFYVRWDFSPTLKELKASGDLDRACEMMLGKDYITIQPAKTTNAQPAKKETANKDDKQ